MVVNVKLSKAPITLDANEHLNDVRDRIEKWLGTLTAIPKLVILGESNGKREVWFIPGDPPFVPGKMDRSILDPVRDLLAAKGKSREDLLGGRGSS